MLAELGEAIEAAAWPRALDLALAAWRATRAVELADLVDAVASRCEQPPTESWFRIHPWWMGLAASYQPIAVSVLARTATERQRNAVDPDELEQFSELIELVPALRDKLPDHGCLVARFAAMRAWPDDPRASQVLARWLVEGPLEWRAPHDVAMRSLYELIATRLAVMADPRVRPLIVTGTAEPRGDSDATRALQIQLARRVLAAIDARPPTLSAADTATVAKWLAALAPPVLVAPEAIDVMALWREAARDPDDDARRMVLADALLESGDDRGELIALACSNDPAAASRARSLLSQNWERWLGDLALMVKRTRTELSRGFIVEIQVGRFTTPPWVYAKVRGHRELLAVRTLRPHASIQAAHFAEVIDGLATDPERIALTPDILRELVARRERWAIRAVEYKHQFSRQRPIEEVFAMLPSAMPELTEIRIDLGGYVDYDPVAVVARLPADHPALRRIEIAARDRTDRSRLAALAQLPLVEVVMS